MGFRGWVFPTCFLKRARHVIYENHLRTKEVSEAMKDNDINKIGRLMSESIYHQSLKNDYSVPQVKSSERYYGSNS